MITRPTVFSPQVSIYIGSRSPIEAFVFGGTVNAGDTVGYLKLHVDENGVQIRPIEIVGGEELENREVLNGLHAARVFVGSFMVNKSVRLNATILLVVILSFVWVPVRDRLTEKRTARTGA